MNAGTVGSTVNIDLTGVASLYILLSVSEDSSCTHIPIHLLTKYTSLYFTEKRSGSESINEVSVTLSGVKDGSPKVELCYSNMDAWLPIAQISFYGTGIV